MTRAHVFDSRLFSPFLLAFLLSPPRFSRLLRSTRPLNEPATFPGFGLLFFLGFRLRFALGSPFFPRRIALALASPRLNSLPGLKLNSRSWPFFLSRAQLNPRPYAHEPPRARCMPFLGSGLPLIPSFVLGLRLMLEVFSSGFESRPRAKSNSPLNSKLAPA